MKSEWLKLVKLKNIIFWSSICVFCCVFSSCSASDALQDATSDHTYTGIPASYVELTEIHLLDIDKVKYSVYVDQYFGLKKVTIARNKELIEISGTCLKDIHFPNLQTLRVLKSPVAGSSKASATIFKMDFHYFGERKAALSENVEFQDRTLKLLVTDDLSSKLLVDGMANNLAIECQVRKRDEKPNKG